MKNLIPKVLIAAPTSERKKHLLDKWLESLNSLDYNNIDLCLCDTTPDNDDYYNLLKTKKVKGKEIIVLKEKWNYKEEHVIQMLAHARERIRDYFLNNDYEYLFFLDDDIFVPKWAVQRLLSYNKDCVGFYVAIYHGKDRRPCVLKSGEIVMGKGLEFYSYKEIKAYQKYIQKLNEDKLTSKEKKLYPFLVKDRWHPQLFKAYGVNMGCLMIKREVMEKVPFRTHPTFIYGEDLWFFTEANEKHFEFWCDTSIEPVHKNVRWADVIKKGPKMSGDFYIAMGPSESDKVQFIK